MVRDEKIEVIFNVKDNYVIAMLVGWFSIDEAIANFDYVVNHPDYKTGMHRIWDITKADFEYHDNDDIDVVAKYPIQFPPGINNVKDAFVSPLNHNWTLMTYFKSCIQDMKNQVEVFNDLELAIDWIILK